MGLTGKRCIPCEGGIPPLTEPEENKLHSEIPGWKILREDIHKLQKRFTFPDFKETLDFVNRVGTLAENENHHPNITFTYGKATIEIWTHAVRGLTENDFILAAKVDQL